MFIVNTLLQKLSDFLPSEVRRVSLSRSTIAVGGGGPVTVPGEKVEIQSSTTELGVSVSLQISQSV